MTWFDYYHIFSIKFCQGAVLGERRMQFKVHHLGGETCVDGMGRCFIVDL